MAGQGMHYWMMQWQVAVCSLIIAGPAAGAAVVIRRARPELLTYSDLWKPCHRRLHPVWLLCFRVVAMVVMTWVLYDIVLFFGPFIFYFYTMWTFVLVIIYFAIAAAISAHGCWKYSKQVVHEKEEAEEQDGNKNRAKLKDYTQQGNNQEKAGFWGYLMQIVYQICGGAVMQTDLVFWCLLLPFMSRDVFSLTQAIVLMHSVNAVFLLLDTAFSRLDFPWFRMAYFVLFSCVYIIFHWILHACGSTWWPYPFLELATPWAPLWYMGLALVHIPCYGLYYLIVKAKNSYFPKDLPHPHQKAH